MPFTPEDWIAGEAWAEPVDLQPLIDRLRVGGIDVNVARVESDGRAGDPPVEPGRIVDCCVCESPAMVTGVEIYVAGRKHYRLACGHLARAS